jgi:thiosulfate/3-mercaptopyruvate sulfurtransferase
MLVGAVAATGVLAQPGASAGQARAALLVEPAWLASHLDDADLVILHVGRQADYDAGHIPGARLASMSDVSERRGENNTEMLSNEVLRERLAAWGIGDRSRIVAYFATTNLLTSTTRIMLTLDHAGLGGRSSMLNGGLDAWKAAGQAVSTEATPNRAGQLAPLTTRPVIVDAEYVRDHLSSPGTAVVDARTTAYYSGAQTGGGRETPHKTGHITGAKSVPFSTITGDDMRLLDEDALRALFVEAGVKPGDTVVGYCHLGQQATAMLFAARTLGHRVLLYDGSFEDWSRHEGYPVTNPGGR